jgi:hypothetical protein
MDLYDGRTAKYWRDFWTILCEMAYLRHGVCEEIVIVPNDGLFFIRNAKRLPEEITLDYTWKVYSSKYKEPQVVPELKRMHVPRQLVEDLGIEKWFSYSFPNCKVTYW